MRQQDEARVVLRWVAGGPLVGEVTRLVRSVVRWGVVADSCACQPSSNPTVPRDRVYLSVYQFRLLRLGGLQNCFVLLYSWSYLW